MHRIHPVADPWADVDLNEAYRHPPTESLLPGSWVRVNFVMSLDGAIVGEEGLSKSLGTPADRTVFRLAREQSDVVLVGAGTLRAEDYSASARPLAIVSGRLELAPTLRVFADRDPEHPRPMIITSQRAADRAPDWMREAADVIPCGQDDVDLTAGVRLLADRGLPRMLCEGGPALFTDLLEADLVDDLILTIVPRLVGSSEHLATRPQGFLPPRRMRLVHAFVDDGTVLTRYATP